MRCLKNNCGYYDAMGEFGEECNFTGEGFEILDGECCISDYIESLVYELLLAKDQEEKIKARQ